MRKYELLYYTHVGDSNPMDSIKEVQEALYEQTGHRFTEEQVQAGEVFTDGHDLILVSAYDSEENEDGE